MSTDLRWRMGADLWNSEAVTAAKQALIDAAAGVERGKAQQPAPGTPEYFSWSVRGFPRDEHAITRDASAESTARQIVADLDEMVAVPGNAAAAVARFMASRPKYGETETGKWSPEQVRGYKVDQHTAVSARVDELKQTVRDGYEQLEAVAERRILGPTDNRAGDEERFNTLGLGAIVGQPNTDGAAVTATGLAVDDPDLRRILQSPLVAQWQLVNAPKSGDAFRRRFRAMLLESLVAQQPASPGARLLAETAKIDLLAAASMASGQEFTEKLVGSS